MTGILSISTEDVVHGSQNNGMNTMMMEGSSQGRNNIGMDMNDNMDMS
jgi:hypothetical protein